MIIAMKEIKNKRQPHISSKANYRLVDIFRHYEYKDVDPTKVQGRNWVAKSEIVSGHKYSVTLAEWKEIITAYFNVILEHLIQGEEVSLPYAWGTLYMVRWKPTYLKWWEDYSWTDGYKTCIRWKKKNLTVMGGLLRFYWSEKCLQTIKNALDKDRFLINNYLKL